MKKIISIILLLSLCFSFTACRVPEPREISCEEIIAAYKAAGYSNIFHLHSDEDYQISGSEECYIIIHKTEDDDSDLIEIKTFYTEGEAKDAADSDSYNIARWLIAFMFGEWRWLNVEVYGKIEYSSYNEKMLRPLKDLIK